MLREVLINENISIKDSLKIIDKGAIKLALVVDENQKLLGTISDGDIRRAILNGFSLEDSIKNIYNKNPFVANKDYNNEEIIKYCTKNKIYQIPVIDENKKVIDILLFDELLKEKEYPNKVVLMVGGLGTRLRPLTENTPKPLLKVGGKPILETIIENFKKYGFVNFVLCINYKAEMIKEYFGDGRKFGVNIEYVLEDKRMGTAGALSLLKEKPKEPFFVMNGDLLTNINFENMLQFHLEHQAIATMGVREYEYQVPYGVVNVENEKIISIDEKPIHKFFVNAGIYILDPETIDIIPKNNFFDMPTLFDKLIEDKQNTVSFPLREYWLDIGRIEEYERANNEYHKVF